MLSRKIPVILAAVLVTGAFVIAAPTADAQRQTRRPVVRLVSPQRGDVLRAGEVITIRWEFVQNGTTIPPGADLSWCEQEIFLSLDGGRSLDRRITIHLDPAVRSTQWTVPNTPSDQAVLDVHYGCEADGLPNETPNVQKQAMFRIVSSGIKPPEVAMKAMPKDVFAGDELDLSWESDVPNLDHFDVQVSYNRGAEFVTVASTSESNVTWTVPSDYVGNLTFRVVAVATDGTTVESPTLVRGHRLVKRR